MEPIRIAVVMGGPSVEHDVSIKTGTNVVDKLDKRRFSVLPVRINRDSSWQLAAEPWNGNTPFCPDKCFSTTPTLQAGTAVTILKSRKVRVVFIALHGPFGEDGTLQGLLEASALPYTGSGVAASALGINKINTKAILRYHGIPVAEDVVVGGPGSPLTALSVEEIEQKLGYPCVVKAPCLGSSFGVVIAKNQEELVEAIRGCGSDYEPVLIEKYIKGTELTCGIVTGKTRQEAQALPVTEIVPKSAEFFDYEAKYTPGATDEITPARIPEAVAQKVQELTCKVFHAIGCDGMSRVDFFYANDELFVIEINTIPGMTETSLLPQQAAAVGIDFTALLSRIVDRAIHKSTEGE